MKQEPEDSMPSELPIWVPRADDRDPISNTARLATVARSEDEYRRLLYVAMTRAEDRLYVCGWRGARLCAQLFAIAIALIFGFGKV